MNIFRIAFFFLITSIYLFASSSKDVSLQLQWKYQFQFAGYIMAKEKGFYKDIGLDVNIKEWKYGINMADEIVNGKSEYAILRPTSMIDISKGKKIKYLATIYQSSPLVLIADKSSGITKIQDFRNKKVMTTGDLNTDTSIISMMFSQGVKLSDVVVQAPSFNVKDLLNGKTDLMASYISNEPYRLKELGGEPIIFSPKDYGFDFYNDIVSTSQDYLDKNPKEVKEFTQATLRGWEYAFSNIEETVDIIFNKYNSQNKSKNALRYEGNELKKLAYFQTEKIGKIEKKKLEKIYDVYKLLGFVKTNIDFNKIVYNEVFQKTELTLEEQEYLNNKDFISVMSLTSLPPFNFRIDNKPVGYSIEIMELIGKVLNKEIKFIKRPWNKQLELLRSGKLDVIPHIAITNAREEYIDYTDFSHLNFLIGLATSKETVINSMSDLEGKIVAVVKDYYIHHYIKRNFPNIKLLPLDTTEDVIDALARGKAYAVVDNMPSLNYFIKEKWLSNLKLLTVNDFGMPLETNLHMGVKKGNYLLKSILEKVNANLPQEEISRIKNKWLEKTNLQDYKLALTNKEKEFIKENPIIRFRVRPDLAPFELQKNGKPDGMAVDYIKIIAKNSGFTPQFVINEDSLADAFDEIKNKREKYDTLLYSVKNEQRQKEFSYGHSYLAFPMMIITHKKSNIINSMFDLKDKTIVAEEGYLTKEWIKKDYPNIKIVTAKNTQKALEMLNNMKVDAYIGNLALVNFSIAKHNLENIRIAAPSPYDDVKFSFIAPKEWPELASILTKGYKNIKLEKHKALQQKWFAYHTIERVDYNLVWKVLIFATLIILWFIWWNRHLQKTKEKIISINKKLDKANKEINTYLDIVDKNVITSSTDLEGNITSVSDAFCKISGYSKEELIGKNHRIIRHPDMENEVYDNIWNSLNENDTWIGEIKNIRKDGTFYWVKATISPIYNEDKIKIGYTAIRHDITDKKKIEEISITDGLTNIYNRRHFNEVFPKIINSAKRNNELISFIIMDVDFFKQYNDSFGHQKGDDCLIEIAQVIKKSLKRADDYCFRLGGEEFGVIFKVGNKDKALKFANKLKIKIEDLKIEHSCDCENDYITASLGLVSKNANDINSVKEIFKEADDLLYEAKKLGRNTIVSNINENTAF